MIPTRLHVVLGFVLAIFMYSLSAQETNKNQKFQIRVQTPYKVHKPYIVTESQPTAESLGTPSTILPGFSCKILEGYAIDRPWTHTNIEISDAGQLGFSLNPQNQQYMYSAFCPVNLPHGVTIKKIGIRGRVNTNNGDINVWFKRVDRSRMSLEKRPHRATQYDTTVAQLALSKRSNGDRLPHLYTENVLNLYIDLSRYAYYFQIQMFKGSEASNYDVFLSAIETTY